RRRRSTRRSTGWRGSVAERSAPAEMRWWGWGQSGHPPALGAGALGYLRETVGLGPRPRPPVALASVRLPESRVGDATLDRLRRDALGRAGIHRLRGDREDGARPAPGRPRRPDRARAGPRHRRRARPAPAAGRLGGRARRDQRALPARALGTPRAHLRGGVL